MFPFASHEQHGYSLDYCADLLREAGDLANKYGHRLTTHPGQFTQLGSLKRKVIDAAVRELNYHCQMLDLMGTGADGVMIVHVGSARVLVWVVPNRWFCREGGHTETNYLRSGGLRILYPKYFHQTFALDLF